MFSMTCTHHGTVAKCTEIVNLDVFISSIGGGITGWKLINIEKCHCFCFFISGYATALKWYSPFLRRHTANTFEI